MDQKRWWSGVLLGAVVLLLSPVAGAVERAPRNPSPYPGRSCVRGILVENSIGKLATL